MKGTVKTTNGITKTSMSDTYSKATISSSRASVSASEPPLTTSEVSMAMVAAPAAKVTRMAKAIALSLSSSLPYLTSTRVFPKTTSAPYTPHRPTWISAATKQNHALAFRVRMRPRLRICGGALCG